MSNPFFHPFEYYKRDFDIVGNAMATTAQYLSLVTGISREACYEYVSTRVEQEKIIKSPKIRVLYRDEPRGDRKKGKIDFLEMLEWVADNKHMLAPNMVVYSDPEKFKSFISDFIDTKIKSRKIKKKLSAAAKLAGDYSTEIFYYLGQTNDKYEINSLSGTLSVDHNFLFYAVGHPTLTSTCRVIVSIANATNEKMTASNRHYLSPEVTKATLAYLCRCDETKKLAELIDKRNLHIPTVDETFDIVHYSASRYWRGDDHFATIRLMIENMSGAERAAVCYLGDMNSLMRLDDSYMRTMFTKIIGGGYGYVTTMEEAKALIENADSDQVALNGMLCYEMVRGKKISALTEAEYLAYATSLRNIVNVFEEYSDDIKILWSNAILPPEIHSITGILRDSAAGSDTDSSIYTCANQAKWFCGDYGYTLAHIKSAALSQYICSQVIANSLAVVSAQFGITDINLFRLTMKAEFFIPCMMTTSKTKHYAFLKSACEGDVYASPQLEAKGVGLRGSKVSRIVHAASSVYYSEVMERTMTDKMITPLEVMSVPAYLEHMMIPAIENHEVWPLSMGRVNKKDAYDEPMSSDYLHYVFWNKVFGSRYGEVQQLPANFIKVPVSVTKSSLKAFIAAFPPDMAQAVQEFVDETGKREFTNIFVPLESISDGKFPAEITQVNLRGHLASAMSRYYLIMECFGLFFAEPNNAKLVSDFMTLEEAEENLIIDKSMLKL